MLPNLLRRLYAFTLKLYPRSFSNEFGDEMQSVFAQALNEVNTSGTSSIRRVIKMMGLFLKEVWDLPAAYRTALKFHAVQGNKELIMNGAGNGKQVELDVWTGRSASWNEALAGALPFLLFGLAYSLIAITELRFYNGIMLGYIRYAPPAVYLLIVIGLAVGWLRNFPRWSYSYLGMALYFGWNYSNGRFHGVVYGWRAWIPLLAVALVVILVSRSLRPLGQLIRDAWNDWTRLSFALYGFALPMLTIIFFDSDWGISEIYGLVFDTLLLATGAVAFLRSRTIWGRALTLQATMWVLVIKGIAFVGWFSPRRQDLVWHGVLAFFLLYGVLMFLPGVVGLLRRGVSSLSTR